VHLGHLRRRDPHERVLLREPHRARGLRNAVPPPRVGLAHALHGEGSQDPRPRLGRRPRLAPCALASRPVLRGPAAPVRDQSVLTPVLTRAVARDRVLEPAPRGGDEPAQVEGDQVLTGHRGGAVGRDEAAEHRRLFVLSLDGGDHEASTRPGDGHREHAQLVVQHAAPGDPGVVAVATPVEDVGEHLGAEQRVTQAQVRPGAVLHAGDHHRVPLPPSSVRRREHLHRVLDHPARAQRVGREVLGEQVLGELDEGGTPVALGEELRVAQQRQHDVEVVVRPLRRRALTERSRPPALGHARRLPQRPQPEVRLRSRPDRSSRGRKDPAHPPRTGREVRGDRVQHGRRQQRRGQQLARASCAAGSALRREQGTTQPAQGERVETTVGRGEQVERRVLVERHAPCDRRHRQEERPRRGLVTQRGVDAVRTHRHPRRAQRASQRRDLGARPRDDREPSPGHLAPHVLLAQRARHDGVLLAEGSHHPELEGGRVLADAPGPHDIRPGDPRSGLGGRDGRGDPRPPVGGPRDDRDVLGDRHGRRAQRGRLPPGGAQHDLGRVEPPCRAGTCFRAR